MLYTFFQISHVFICLICWDLIQKQYSSGPFKTVHIFSEVEWYGLSALKQERQRQCYAAKVLAKFNSMSVIGGLITRFLWWIMASQNRLLGLLLLCESREHLHHFKMLFAGLIWKMYCHLVQKGYFFSHAMERSFRTLQWQRLSPCASFFIVGLENHLWLAC